MYKNISDNFKTELFNRSRMNRGYITPIEEFSQKGTNININNSVEGKASIKLNGKSTQEIRSGKNLWKPIATATKSGITFTNNGDGSYTLNGTATSATSFYISGLNYATGTYTLSANNAATNSNGAFYIQAEYSGGSITLPFTSLNAKTTKTTTNSITACSVVIPNGITLTNFTFKPQLEAGSTATEYEQYGASPSPDYPSEIESISGNVEIKLTGINQWNNDLVNTKNVTKNTDGFTMNGIWGTDVLENKDILKTFKPNTKYTIKTISKILAKPTTLGTSGTSGYDLVFYRANNTLWLPLNNYEKYTSNVGDIFTLYKTITTPADLTNLRVLGYSFYGNNDGSTTYKGTGSVEIQQIMVVEGTYTESNFPNYEPYQSSSTTIDLKGNELTKYDKLIIKDGKATIQKKSRHLSLAIKDMNNSDAYPGWTNQMQLREDYPNLNNSFKTANISMLSNITEDTTAIGLNTAGSTNVLLLYTKLFNGMTQTEIKNAYPDLVFDLIYELAEPYEIDLGEVDTLNTFEGTTYISNSEDADMEVEYNGYGEKINNFVQSQFSVISKSSVDGKIIGNVIAKDFQCQIYNAKNYDLANKEIDVFTGLRFQDETEEYVPWGKFIVDTYENVESSNYVTIKAMDYMIKFNPDYIDNNSYPCYFKNWVVNFLNYFGVESGQLSYKLTTDTEIDNYKEYYKKNGDNFELVEEPSTEEISTYYEVTFGGLSNENFYVSETPEIANLTGRQILKSIAEMFGSFATIGRDNKLYFKLKETPTNSSDIPKLPRSVLHSLTKNQEYSPINVVVLKLGQVEGENITKRDEASVLKNGEHVIQIEDNVFLNSQVKREAAINELFERLNGFAYTDFSAEWKSFMYLDVGDAIQVQNKDDDEYFDSILLNQVVYIPNTTKSTISAPSESKTDEKYQFTEEQKQWNLFTELRVNKVEGEITSTTKKTQDIEDDLNNNYYTKTNINELVQTSETGITNTFSEAGGNNIFRNTGLWFSADTVNIQNLYNQNFTYCTYNPDAINKALTNVYPSSSDITNYIRNEELIEINPVYEYSLSVPELVYKHDNTELSYKTSLLELTSNREFQLENGSIIKHELSAGTSSIKFKSDTAYVIILLENQNSSRNIVVGDDLSGKTVYSTLPDNFYETISEEQISSQNFITGSGNTYKNFFQIYSKLTKDIYYVGINTTEGEEQDSAPYDVFYTKNDMALVNEKSLTLNNKFGEVTSINTESPAYQYFKIGIDTQATISDAKTTLKDFSIQIKTSDNLYEYWQGEVVKSTNDNAANNNSMLLLNGELYQEQEVPNGSYSVSFYYQKLIELANASVIINDNEYQLDSTEVKQFYTGEQDSETKEYITQPIKVTTNHIRITFKCDADKGVEIYDLMCNKGSVKLAYSQNENETTTETVNISKGITITSTNMETIFKANANGIKILTLQNATIAYFTDKGLSTKEIVVENEAQICGTLVQEVGDQTWFTRM